MDEKILPDLVAQVVYDEFKAWWGTRKTNRMIPELASYSPMTIAERKLPYGVYFQNCRGQWYFKKVLTNYPAPPVMQAALIKI
jgi:hypothetical protein